MGNQIYYDYVILSIVPLTLMLANSDVICQTGANHLKRSPTVSEQAPTPLAEMEPQGGPWKEIHSDLKNVIEEAKKHKKLFKSQRLSSQFFLKSDRLRIPCTLIEYTDQTYFLSLRREEFHVQGEDISAPPLNVGWLVAEPIEPIRKIDFEFSPNGVVARGQLAESRKSIPITLTERPVAVNQVFEIFKMVAYDGATPKK